MKQTARKVVESLCSEEFGSCLRDCFPEVTGRYFTDEMNRLQKTNKIIEVINEKEIIDKINKWKKIHSSFRVSVKRYLKNLAVIFIVFDWLKKKFFSWAYRLYRNFQTIILPNTTSVVIGSFVISSFVIAVIVKSNKNKLISATLEVSTSAGPALQKKTFVDQQALAPLVFPRDGGAAESGGEPFETTERVSLEPTDADASTAHDRSMQTAAGLMPPIDESPLVPEQHPDRGVTDDASDEPGRTQLAKTQYRPIMRLIRGSGNKSSYFYISQTEITQGQYGSVQGSKESNSLPLNDAKILGDLERPIENISFPDTLLYCNSLSALEGLERCYYFPSADEDVKEITWPKGAACKGYRIPTEEEWNTAALGGERSPDTESGNLYAGAWFKDNAEGDPHKVSTKHQNKFGLFDMLGNVAEWVWPDARSELIFRPSRQDDTVIYTADTGLLARGGSWNSELSTFKLLPREEVRLLDYKQHEIGIRIVRSSPSSRKR